MRPKPTRPTTMLNLDQGVTLRQYADHLNMLVNYHLELDRWNVEQRAALEACLREARGPVEHCGGPRDARLLRIDALLADGASAALAERTCVHGVRFPHECRQGCQEEAPAAKEICSHYVKRVNCPLCSPSAVRPDSAAGVGSGGTHD
jgi:hypothetical protein